MDTKQLIEQIIDKQRVASQEVSQDPFSTYAVRLGNKRQAINELEELTVRYRYAALESAIFIFASGDKVDEFAELSKTDFGVFTFGSKDIYKEVALKVEPKIRYGQLTNAYMIDMIEESFDEICDEVGIESKPQMTYKHNNECQINSIKDIERYAEKTIADEIGKEVLGYIFVSRAAKQAVEEQRSSSFIPVLIKCSSLQEANELKQSFEFTKKTFVVGCGMAKGQKKLCSAEIKEIDKEKVQELLVSIKEQVQ